MTISGLMSCSGMQVYLATSSASACSQRQRLSLSASKTSSTDIATSLKPANLFKSSSASISLT
uniref:Uncharacterized protein n=1 Tax=Arundo donax TaxID=35708 RepID=A0A0A9G2W2_ARUDO